jgi:hypothetical protein
MLKISFLLFAAMTVSRPGFTPAYAGTQVEFRSGEAPTHLLELFSSEGCSSCPPADAWLASLRKQPGLWKAFVPIEFHVDYWNRLGWTDPLSKPHFTERQQNYAKEWSSSSVYTPGFVLDGAEWNRSRAAASLSAPTRSRVGMLSAKSTGKYSFHVTFLSTQPLGSVRINAALLGNGLESRVSAGENSGSVLKHEFAVLSIVQQEMDSDKNRFTAVVDIKPAHDISPKSFSAAFWITEGASQKAIQAVGGDL